MHNDMPCIGNVFFSNRYDCVAYKKAAYAKEHDMPFFEWNGNVWDTKTCMPVVFEKTTMETFHVKDLR